MSVCSIEHILLLRDECLAARSRGYMPEAVGNRNELMLAILNEVLDHRHLVPEAIDASKVTIGQHADYLDTGMWDMKDGGIVAPEDLTIEQLKDFLTISGGTVHLRQDMRFVWLPIETGEL